MSSFRVSTFTAFWRRDDIFCKPLELLLPLTVDLHIVELARLLEIVLVLFWMSNSLGAPSTKEMEERLGLGPPVLLRLLHYVALVQHKLATLVA